MPKITKKPSEEPHMKLRTWTSLSGLLLAATLASAQSATPNAAVPATPEHAGFVKNVRGDVQLINANGAMRPAAAGDVVAPTERIVTGKDSGGSVILRDGTTLVVGPSSRLDLKEFSFDATTQDGGMVVSLLRGTLRMITGLIGKTHPDAVRVETQTVTIGIRGTDFIVEADAL
jgi:hypothetical protein